MYSNDELIKIAKMYYELGLTQKQISENLNYSRPTISRMLEAAMEKGIVKVTVQYPVNSMEDIENEIKEKYKLKKVSVSPTYVEDEELIKKDVGKALAKYLYDICNPEDILGISWGTTLNSVTKYLKAKEIDNFKIVQLNGGISKNSFTTGSIALLEKFAKSFSAEFHLLSVPTIVDSAEIANAILKDSSISETIDLGSRCNIALFGIGKTSYRNILFKGGYFKEKEYSELIEKGAVGDICSRYFDIQGNLVDLDLNDRTIGLQLESLKRKQHSIAMAIGQDKTRSVYGAIKGGYLNTLFIDESLARLLLKLEES
ncbi:sugar-binding transcriptional regulator [Virgibacillus sp. W0430]|uniref:sugar-binding transcriptional regulator n=1 Tax=Virgibacillus sp. W0430 TaxID=3391580 RepID=UPI003F46A671